MVVCVLVSSQDMAARGEKDRIKAAHAEKEQALIDGLHAQMSSRKQMLEER